MRLLRLVFLCMTAKTERKLKSNCVAPDHVHFKLIAIFISRVLYYTNTLFNNIQGRQEVARQLEEQKSNR